MLSSKNPINRYPGQPSRGYLRLPVQRNPTMGRFNWYPNSGIQKGVEKRHRKYGIPERYPRTKYEEAIQKDIQKG